MTGHGRAVAEADGRRATIEIRSVNHRFLDLKIRGFGLDAALEERISQAVRRSAERGAFTVSIRDEGLLSGTGTRIDVEAAKRVHNELDNLRATLGIKEPVTLETVVAQPGVLLGGLPPEEPDDVWKVLGKAVDAALDQLCAMREREGAALVADVEARLSRLEKLADAIGKHQANAPAEWKKRLEDRVQKILSGPETQVDSARLATEVALLADRLDVTEELVRLRSHVGQMRGLLARPGPVGRRLDFLAQEMGREVNTIGSKSQSANIAALVVDAKAELEKIREQVQNVE